MSPTPQCSPLPHLIFILLFFCIIPQLYARKCPKVLNPPTPRIVGGSQTTLPYLVALFNPDADFKCTATLIAPGWVITARHCLVTNLWHARQGGPSRLSGPITQLDQVHIARGYNADLALIKLSNALKSPIYPSINVNPTIPRPASFARAVGYGRTSYFVKTNAHLRQVDVPVTDQKTCRKAYPTDIDHRRICAGYARGGCDACLGDSGGPLFQYTDDGLPVIVGTVSAGRGCALPKFPGIYTRINVFEPWIRSITNDYNNATNVNSVFSSSGTENQKGTVSAPTPAGATVTPNPSSAAQPAGKTPPPEQNPNQTGGEKPAGTAPDSPSPSTVDQVSPSSQPQPNGDSGGSSVPAGENKKPASDSQGSPAPPAVDSGQSGTPDEATESEQPRPSDQGSDGKTPLNSVNGDSQEIGGTRSPAWIAFIVVAGVFAIVVTLILAGWLWGRRRGDRVKGRL